MFCFLRAFVELLHMPDFLPKIGRHLLWANHIIDFALTKLYEIIHVIQMDNNTVETTINLHKLLNGLEPIRITIIEKRDNIGIFRNHYLQNFEFNEMVVRN